MITCHDDKVQRMIAAGILSPRTKRFELSLEAGGVAILKQEIFVTADEFDALAALMAEAESQTIVVDETGRGALDITPLGKEWRERIAKP